MTIGLIDEAPNDTDAIKNILVKQYKDVRFISLLQPIRGSQLDSQKMIDDLHIEYAFQKPDLVIFIRDLDHTSLRSEKFKQRNKTFEKVNKVVDRKGIFLLHIYEIEALILTGIDIFNKMYNTNIVIDKDVSTYEEPKELLKNESYKYNESQNAEILNKIPIKTLINNCKYFSEFITKLEAKILEFE